MLSIFSNTMELLKDSFPELMSVIHVAPNHHVEKYITGIVHKWPVPAVLIPGGLPQLKYDAFSVTPVSSLCNSC
jgi:lipid-A-disaccharide synthase